jgi:hypothetical protein
MSAGDSPQRGELPQADAGAVPASRVTVRSPETEPPFTTPRC